MLIVLSGLPGVGKTEIARALAQVLEGVHIRVDSIEQVLRDSGVKVEGEGYEVAYAVAEDNVRVGRVVIADCVNPWPLTRDAWRAVAARANVPVLEVEVACSDVEEHRRRVESRAADIPGHVLPAWSDVTARDYRPWDRERFVLDTSHRSVGTAVDAIVSELRRRQPSGENA